MGEDETIELLKSIDKNSVGLREILKEVGDIDQIVASGRDISPGCSKYVGEGDIADSESIVYDMGEIKVKFKGDKEVEISKDSQLLSEEGYEEREQKYVEKLEAAGYKIR